MTFQGLWLEKSLLAEKYVQIGQETAEIGL